MISNRSKVGKTATQVLLASCILVGAQFTLSDPAANQQTATLVDHLVVPFEFPVQANRVHVLDLDGDARNDFLFEFPDKLQIQFQNSAGTAFSSPLTIPLQQRQVAWDLCSGHEIDPTLKVMVVREGERIESWSLVNQMLSGPVVELTELNVFIPEIVGHMPFCRDINNDGADDFVLPQSRSSVMYLRLENLSYRKLIPVQTATEVSTTIHASTLRTQVGQSISVPPLTLRDVNGDDLFDLVVQTPRKLAISIADANSESYFPVEPTISRDFSQFADRLDQLAIENVDFSDLFSMVSKNQHIVNLKDVDNDRDEDLVMQVGTKVIFFRGENDGIAGQPTQVLKLSSKTIFTALEDFDGDGELELITFQAPKVSLGRVLLLFAVPQAFRMQILIFEQVDGLFTKRPEHSVEVSIKVPRLLGMIQKAKKFEKSIEDSEDEDTAPTLFTQLDGIAEREVLMIADNELRLYWNALAAQQKVTADDLIDQLKSLPKKIDIDIGELMDTFMSTQSPVANLTQVDPIVLKRLEAISKVQDLMGLDMNADDLDDFFVFENQNEERVSGVLMLSQPQSKVD